jgi:sugar/nucleoside kinase (ribokinase family)
MVRREFDCLAIGDVMFDVYVGNFANSIHFLKGGTSYCDFAKIDFGGTGNVASGLALLGGKTAFIGNAGNDCWGRLYNENLKTKGVMTRISYEDELFTGLALVGLESDGERSFCVFRGANDALSEHDVDKSIDLIERSEYLYFSGYSLANEPQRTAILKAAKLAKEHKTKIVFDPGAHNLIRSEPRLFAKALDLCDVFLPNFDEASEITCTINEDGITSALRTRAPFTAMKCGEDGCVLITKRKIVRIPSFNVKCVDSTGAGDAFAAGLIYGIVKGLPLFSTGRLANWLASKVVTRFGARSFPSRTEIRGFLKEMRTAEK